MNKYASDIVNEISSIIDQISDNDISEIIKEINQANRIFIAGAGRSGLAIRAFAMRLMQVGYHVHVVGETVTPAIRNGDVLLIASGSGETESLVQNANKASKLKVRIVLLTTNLKSSIAQLADLILVIPTGTEKLEGSKKSQQVGASAFEQTLFLLGDVIISQMIGEGIVDGNVMSRHANLE